MILLIVFCIGLLAFGFLGYQIGFAVSNRWHYCSDVLPPKSGRTIKNYPVAFFDHEFGIVVDQAEYHPNGVDKWRTVPYGEPCYPYAWYDLPNPPHPLYSPESRSSVGRNVDIYI